MPTLADLHRILQEMAGEDEAGEAARQLAVLLKPYALELWADLFARPTTADLGNPFIVYDVRGLDEGLRPLAIYLIAGHTWREARRDPRRRVFAMDEVTQLLRYPESGRLVADVYLQGRFVGLSAWSMAQAVPDYLATHEGRQALDMADTVLLLRQKDAETLDAAARRFALTPGQRSFLETAGIGQGVLATSGRGNTCLAIDPPPVVLEWLPRSPAHHQQPAAETPAPTALTPEDEFVGDSQGTAAAAALSSSAAAARAAPLRGQEPPPEALRQERLPTSGSRGDGGGGPAVRRPPSVRPSPTSKRARPAGSRVKAGGGPEGTP